MHDREGNTELIVSSCGKDLIMHLLLLCLGKIVDVEVSRFPLLGSLD